MRPALTRFLRLHCGYFRQTGRADWFILIGFAAIPLFCRPVDPTISE
jgi:hypothetical protein